MVVFSAKMCVYRFVNQDESSLTYMFEVWKVKQDYKISPSIFTVNVENCLLFCCCQDGPFRRFDWDARRRKHRIGRKTSFSGHVSVAINTYC